MKILMISNHLGVQSGVQRYVQNLLLHLDTAKYRVTLFVGQCPPDQASTAPALEAHGVEILAVPDNKKDRIRALAAHLRTHKDYDIIHYHTASKIGAPVCGIVEPPLCYISVNLAGKKAAQLGYAWQLLPVQGIFVPLVKE